MNIVPRVIRMQELSVGDYYTGDDREKDEKAIQFFFNKDSGAARHLDGVRMIKQFVQPNRMTQWSLTKKTKKIREGAIK